MKPNTKNNQETENVIPIKIYILIAVGLILLVVPIISLLVDTQLILIKHITRIANGSNVYNMLQEEIPGAFVHVYVFNVTNGEAFVSGEDEKLKLQEVGPFIYQEFRKNDQFELDEEAGVMRYTPRLWTKFVPEGSVGDPHKINVTVPNVALLAMASMLSDYPFLTKTGFNFLVTQVNAPTLLNVDVHSQLWGYEEPLISVGNKLLPGWINFSKMGILDRLYDPAAIPRFELGITNEDKFRVKTLNGARGLTAWEYENPSKRTRCNTLVDTYEGIAYPPALTPKTKLRLYRNVFCRMIDLDLVGTRTIDYGPEAFIYKINNDTFNIGPNSECLCGKRSCKNGVSDLSPCLYNLPLALSHAHFLHADPQLYERIEGIHPDETKHGSEFVVDPKIGVVLQTHFTLQISVDVQDVKYNRQARSFSNMVVPLAYFTIVQAELPEEGKETIKSLHINFFYMIHGSELGTFILGLVVLLFAARAIFLNLFCSNRLSYKISKMKKPSNIVQVEEPLMNDKDFGRIKVLESDN
ncbi:scavenger receptor class B member 1-like [Maniola hyperantus]|uniref:scavenger receptor class B member 1-like n=1 Tax=Aphantopus hyperantus TaxID=2795564 RepID=UPI0037495109